jgi:hypothetical protein
MRTEERCCGGHLPREIDALKVGGPNPRFYLFAKSLSLPQVIKRIIASYRRGHLDLWEPLPWP